MSSQNVHESNLLILCRVCAKFLGKKSVPKEKYTAKLQKVFFINICNDTNLVHPNKICMKCYSQMNNALMRNSTIAVEIYNNWVSHDDISCPLCLRVANLKAGARSKLNLVTNGGNRGRPSPFKSVWSQMDIIEISTKSSPDYLPSSVHIHDLSKEYNTHLELCKCNLCNDLLRQPVVSNICGHAYCYTCIAYMVLLHRRRIFWNIGIWC